MSKIVPEILCSDLSVTREFYLKVLGFAVLYERAAETFIYLSLGGADLMVEQVDGPGRRWVTGKLEKPFGRGPQSSNRNRRRRWFVRSRIA